jgi:hypothetical protein
MVEYLSYAIISIILVFLTIVVYYELLLGFWRVLPKLQINPRARLMLLIAVIFGGHTITVWIYAIAYWLLEQYTPMGALAENFNQTFFDYLYFSAATYSSLGFGDVYPRYGFRLLAGVEVLNGLILIGCSVSFMYLFMEKFWDLHSKRGK